MTAPAPLDLRRRSAHAVGAASLWVRGQLAGPRRAASVLHAGPDAAYLDLGGACVGVLGARAVQVPCGVRTRLDALPLVAPGSEAVVAGGAVRLVDPGGVRLEVRVSDLVDTTVPALPPAATARGGTVLAGLTGNRLEEVRALLPDEPLDRLAGSDPAAVPALLGLGPGLTPLGDDVLAGWLATAFSCRHPGLDAVRPAVTAAAPARTTTLSATLLACAGRGEVVPEFRTLMAALARDDTTAAAGALPPLLRIGATSGAGLVLGALLALQQRRSPTPSPTEEGAAG